MFSKGSLGKGGRKYCTAQKIVVICRRRSEVQPKGRLVSENDSKIEIGKRFSRFLSIAPNPNTFFLKKDKTSIIRKSALFGANQNINMTIAA